MSKKALTHKDVKNLKKTVEDQTFGMKNKKNSKQAEKLVQSMANTRGGMEKFVAEQFAKKQAKKEEEEEKRLAAELYGQGIAASARVAKQEDEDDGKPKVCPFFKAGVCDKGRKCKLSHELDKEEAVLNIYIDPRDQKKGEGEEATDDKDNIKNWDTKKLEEVVNYNEKKYDNTNKPTEIVCKHFLEAIEKRVYGWFWMCPNGGFKCQYRHALPQGYILKRDMEALKKGDDDDDTRIEDLIDSEIYNMDKKKLTPVTHDRFLEWKKKRMERKQKEQDEKLKADLIKAGHKTKLKSVMSGKSLFVYQPTLFADDADAVDTIEREDQIQEEGEEKGIVHNYDEYYKDNFRKNEKGEVIMEEDEAAEAGEAAANKQEGDGVQIDAAAFDGEEDLDDLPDDV